MTPWEILWPNPYPLCARYRRRRFEREGKNSFTFCKSSCKDTAGSLGNDIQFGVVAGG